MDATMIYWSYIRIMEKKMEATFFTESATTVTEHVVQHPDNPGCESLSLSEILVEGRGFSSS